MAEKEERGIFGRQVEVTGREPLRRVHAGWRMVVLAIVAGLFAIAGAIARGPLFEIISGIAMLVLGAEYLIAVISSEN